MFPHYWMPQFCMKIHRGFAFVSARSEKCEIKTSNAEKNIRRTKVQNLPLFGTNLIQCLSDESLGAHIKIWSFLRHRIRHTTVQVNLYYVTDTVLRKSDLMARQTVTTLRIQMQTHDVFSRKITASDNGETWPLRTGSISRLVGWS